MVSNESQIKHFYSKLLGVQRSSQHKDGSIGLKAVVVLTVLMRSTMSRVSFVMALLLLFPLHVASELSPSKCGNLGWFHSQSVSLPSCGLAVTLRVEKAARGSLAACFARAKIKQCFGFRGSDV